LFGWDINAAEDAPVEYYGISNAGRINGGIIPWSSQMGDVPPNWGVYFSVADCDASVKRVEELGGRLIVAPKDIHPGRFAVVADPAGAVFSVMHLHSPD
jgi:predicted enzyme related to lactoylglutathione lyase